MSQLRRVCSDPRQNGLIRKGQAVLVEWNLLSEELQLSVSREALRRAAETIAEQAEVMAREMEAGGLADRGGTDALRLFAAVVRVNARDPLAPMGTA